MDLWWVLLVGERKASAGAGPALENKEAESVLLLLCLRWQRLRGGEDGGLPQTGTRASGGGAVGLSSSDRMSFLSLVPLEWRWVEMCMSEEYAPSSQAVSREKVIPPLQR